MPYLHWDKVDSHEKRSETIKWVRDKKTSPEPKIDPEDDPIFIGSKLIQAHLAHNGPLHVRRSLNQYYYDSQIDEADVYNFTDALDKDQVVYKYTNCHNIVGRSKATKEQIEKNKHVMMMVDQLWLWVLKEDGITRMIIASNITIQTTKLYSNGCHKLSEPLQRKSPQFSSFRCFLACHARNSRSQHASPGNHIIGTSVGIENRKKGLWGPCLSVTSIPSSGLLHV
jgi:hypothetical protein